MTIEMWGNFISQVCFRLTQVKLRSGCGMVEHLEVFISFFLDVNPENLFIVRVMIILWSPDVALSLGKLVLRMRTRSLASPGFVDRACLYLARMSNVEILEFEHCTKVGCSERVPISKFPASRRNHFNFLRGSFSAVSTPIF